MVCPSHMDVLRVPSFVLQPPSAVARFGSSPDSGGGKASVRLQLAHVCACSPVHLHVGSRLQFSLFLLHPQYNPPCFLFPECLHALQWDFDRK